MQSCIIDTTELRDPVKVRESQEKALQALQAYTLAHYPETPAKFGELLLRIPELQKTCQVSVFLSKSYHIISINRKDENNFVFRFSPPFFLHIE